MLIRFTHAHFCDLFYDAQLGKGAFAVVYETRHRKTKKSYAVKKIMITDSDESELENIRLEIAIMDELKSYKHVVRLKTTFYEPEHIYVVMEKVKGGELFERLAKKEYYNEKEARDACIILFKTMNHCHKRRIAHRDLKPENLLLEKLDDDSRLKIADFGKNIAFFSLLCATKDHRGEKELTTKPTNYFLCHRSSEESSKGWAIENLLRISQLCCARSH